MVAAFLEDPADDLLVRPIMAHGTRDDGARLFDACVRRGALREGVTPTVLHALGYLRYEPARDLLVRHALGVDHAANTAAVLGLWHLPLGEARQAIHAGILACRGKNLFPELLPALAVRTGDPSLVETLYEMGCGEASTDCNGGLVLGIALHGPTGRARFEQLLDDPRWEADAAATGTRGYTWLGMRAQRLSLAERIARIRAWGTAAAPATPEHRHIVSLTLAMIEMRLRNPVAYVREVDAAPVEPLEALEPLIQGWSTPDRDDSFLAVVRTVLVEEHIAARLRALRSDLDVSLEREVSVRYGAGKPEGS
jgi:hypothetical protein